jgi:hypothetical protein
MNWEKGFGACIWNADSEKDLEELFTRTGTPFESIIPVEERIDKTLLPDPP